MKYLRNFVAAVASGRQSTNVILLVVGAAGAGISLLLMICGLSSFANDKGVFRWNADGTRMVYTPAASEEELNNEEQNGFVFDERKKKWVVKEHVVGTKGVRFPSAAATTTSSGRADGGGGGGGGWAFRTRSTDSAGTGTISAMSEFTYYDDVAAPEAAPGGGRRGRSPSVDRPSASWGTGAVPLHSTGTPEEQGVEVPIDGDGEGFVPDTNVDRFLQIGKADSFDNASAVTGFTEAFSSSAPPPIIWIKLSSVLLILTLLSSAVHNPDARGLSPPRLRIENEHVASGFQIKASCSRPFDCGVRRDIPAI